jgi:indolepyruvate ferredoxin oxidoreductase beta subunit
LDLIYKKVGKVIALNGNELAEEAGNPLSLNMVMLGALIGSGEIPVTTETMKETISNSTKKIFLESNLKAFDLGQEVASQLAGKKD